MLLRATKLGLWIGRRLVVEDVSLDLYAGELLGIVGPNACGKTTLLRALAGLQPIGQGLLEVNGTPLRRLSRRQLAKQIGYLPQSAEIHWPLSVERIVTLGRYPSSAPWQRLTREDRNAVTRAMELADIAHLAARPATSLSGGEYMSVHLARLMAGEHRVLLADEPITSLDPQHQLKALNTLRDNTANGVGVVIVLHDLTLAARYCDRIMVMNSGRVVADGVPDQVLDDDILADVFGIQAARLSYGQDHYIIPGRLIEDR
jgi:iron complex transport system ATP-binding protein